VRFGFGFEANAEVEIISVNNVHIASYLHDLLVAAHRRLSSRMDAIAQRVEASKNMQALGQSMSDVVKTMGLAMEAMDVEKVR
jgi:hypothetical protein